MIFSRKLRLFALSLVVFLGTSLSLGVLPTQHVAAASTETGTTHEATDDECPIAETSNLKWIICPLVKIADNTIGTMQGFIQKFLFTPVDPIFDGIEASAKNFRNFGLGLLAISALFMIVSSAIGLEVFDAYTIKKVLPRILVAAIGIAIAFPLLRFVVTMFNDLGVLVGDIIVGSINVKDVNLSFGQQVADATVGNAAGDASTVLALGGLGVLGAAAAGFSAVGALALMGTIILALLVGLLVLGIRQVVIMVCVLFAPIAIAAYILPGTLKIWAFWKNALITTLAMFPIIMAFIAAGTALSVLIGQTAETNESMAFLALLVRYAPFFMLPFAFKLAGGLMSTIFSIANDRSRGLFDRSKNFRGNQRKLFADDLANKRGRAGNGIIGSAYRRATTRQMGGLSLTRAGQDRFAAHERALGQQIAAKSLEADGGRAVGDDHATYAAVRATSRDDFKQRYVDRAMAKDGVSRETAEIGAARALGVMEAGLGQRMGTGNMRVAAFKARAGSSTAYDGSAAGTQERINEGASLIAAGLMTSADATAAGKGNRARLDISGNGFGAQMQAFDLAAQSLRANPEQGGMTMGESEAYLDQTLLGAEPGDMLAGNPRTIDAMMPSMLRQLKIAEQSGDQQQIDRSLAQISGVYDNINRTSPEKARKFADEVMSKKIIQGNDANGNPNEVSIRQAIDAASSRPAYLEVRKEYGSAVPRGSITAAEAERLAAEEAARGGEGR